jgi:hypothetical protein
VSHGSALAAGMSLKPVMGLGAPGVAELNLAVWRLGNEAIPRTLTEEHDLLHTGREGIGQPMRQRMMSSLDSPCLVRRST